MIIVNKYKEIHIMFWIPHNNYKLTICDIYDFENIISYNNVNH